MGEWKGIERLADKLHESDYWQRELRHELEPLLKAADDCSGVDAGPFMQPYFEKLRKAVERWK